MVLVAVVAKQQQEKEAEEEQSSRSSDSNMKLHDHYQQEDILNPRLCKGFRVRSRCIVVRAVSRAQARFICAGTTPRVLERFQKANKPKDLTHKDSAS